MALGDIMRPNVYGLKLYVRRSCIGMIVFS